MEGATLKQVSDADVSMRSVLCLRLPPVMTEQVIPVTLFRALLWDSQPLTAAVQLQRIHRVFGPATI